MSGALKALCGVFLLLGAGLVLWGVTGVALSVRDGLRAERIAEAELVGYRATEVSRRRSIHEPQASPLFHYARFRWEGREIEDPTPQLVRWYRSGDPIRILVPPDAGHAPRLADGRARFLFPVALILFGLLCVTPPAVFLRAFPSLLQAPPPGSAPDPAFQLPEGFGTLDTPVGRVPVLALAKGMGLLLVLGVVAGLWSEYGPHLLFGKDREMLDALRAKDHATALALARAGEGVNATNEYQQTALILALDGEDWELAAALLEAGADPNVESKMLQVPLTMAVRAGKEELVRLLLERGARIDASPEGQLAWAISKEDAAVTARLLEAKPDLTALVSGKWTFRDVAIFMGNAELIALLAEAGATRNLPEACEWVARGDEERLRDALDGPGADEVRRIRCGKRGLREFAEHLGRSSLAKRLGR